jgi:integrase
MLKANPADGVKLPKQATREMMFLDPQQVETLAAELDEEHSALVYVLAYGGLRIGEARALRRSRVNLMRGSIDVKESVTYRGEDSCSPRRRTAKERVVTIPKFLTALLEQHMDRFTGNEWDAIVFPGSDGGPMRLENFRRNRWKPALRRAGLNDNLRIHDMRHTTASLLINQGLHPKIVQEHLGHQSISITFDRYGHLYETDNQRLADALDAAYSTGLVTRETPQTIPDADTSRTNTLAGVTGKQSKPARSQSLQRV